MLQCGCRASPCGHVPPACRCWWLAGGLTRGLLVVSVQCRFSHSWVRSVLSLFSSVFVDFLAVGCLIATVGW